MGIKDEGLNFGWIMFYDYKTVKELLYYHFSFSFNANNPERGEISQWEEFCSYLKTFNMERVIHPQISWFHSQTALSMIFLAFSFIYLLSLYGHPIAKWP